MLRPTYLVGVPLLAVLLSAACGDGDSAKSRVTRPGGGTGGTAQGAAGKGGTTARGASGEDGASGNTGVNEGGAGNTTAGSSGRAAVGGSSGRGGGGSGGTGGEGGESNATAQAGVVNAGGEGGGAPQCGRFVGLGDLPGGSVGSVASALSRDGKTVVGQSESGNGPEAMRWHEGASADVMSGLGDLPGGTFEGRAYAVSGDGSVVAGVSHSSPVDCAGRFDEAFRWTETDGMVALGDITTGCFFSYAYGVSEDGTLIVGGGTNDLSNTGATWSEADEWTDLGFAESVGNSSSVNAVTPDLSVLVGTDRLDDTAEYQAFRYTEAGGQELLGDLPGGIVFATANAVSDDGIILAGYGTTADGEEAFRWTDADGMVSLGDFSGGATSSHANASSRDGSLIVGFGTTASGQVAALWHNGGTIKALADELATRGVSIPPGWTLSEATGVTSDGSTVTFTGNGTNPAGNPEAWLARYCLP